MAATRRLQIIIAQILGVAQAIVGKVITILADMVAHLRSGQAVLVIVRAALTIFIDEVAIMIDEGEIVLARQMAEGGEQAILIILTAGDAEFQQLGTGRRQRQGAGAATRRLVVAERKAIPIGPVGLKPGHFDMDAVAQFRPSDCFATGHDGPEAIIGRDLPFYRDRRHRHAAMRLERARRQLGPDDEAVGRRIARCHAQSEGIAGEPALGAKEGGRAGDRGDGGGGEERAAREHDAPPRTAL